MGLTSSQTCNAVTNWPHSAESSLKSWKLLRKFPWRLDRILGQLNPVPTLNPYFGWCPLCCFPVTLAFQPNSCTPFSSTPCVRSENKIHVMFMRLWKSEIGTKTEHLYHWRLKCTPLNIHIRSVVADWPWHIAQLYSRSVHFCSFLGSVTFHTWYLHEGYIICLWRKETWACEFRAGDITRPVIKYEKL
jgi:hypothetical protein